MWQHVSLPTSRRRIDAEALLDVLGTCPTCWTRLPSITVTVCTVAFCMQTSGNDVFYRNPYNVEECLFVNITSPSSSTYDSVADLGTPQRAAERLRQQYLGEFMSTRLGSQKRVEILSASSREADGRQYYDIEVGQRVVFAVKGRP